MIYERLSACGCHIMYEYMERIKAFLDLTSEESRRLGFILKSWAKC